MSLKIVFNGQEYDGVEAMPPDVRKEYEVALESLRKSGGAEIFSQLQQSGGTHIKATFREIVVNGKKYDSVDAMPPDVRRTYEQAIARLAPGGGTGPAPAAPRPRAVRPPPMVQDDDAPRQNLWRIALWIAVGAVAAWLVLRRG